MKINILVLKTTNDINILIFIITTKSETQIIVVDHVIPAKVSAKFQIKSRIFGKLTIFAELPKDPSLESSPNMSRYQQCDAGKYYCNTYKKSRLPLRQSWRNGATRRDCKTDRLWVRSPLEEMKQVSSAYPSVCGIQRDIYISQATTPD